MTAEPVAWTGSGSIAAMKAGLEGCIWPERASAHPIPLYAAPQAVPAEDVATALAEVDELERYGNATSRHIRAALISLSAERTEAGRWSAEWHGRYVASEAEATALRRRLEEAEHARDEWRATHGRVVEGFMEVCESVGVQFDAPEAVAYAINAKIGNAEHDRRAAERKLEEAREALAEARERINRYADTAAEHDLMARIDALSGASE